MNIAIVDDSADDVSILSGYIQKYCQAKGTHVNIRKFQNGEAFLSEFQEKQFALIFLDIYMGGQNGIEVAERIRTVDSASLIVFTTTSRLHAVESYHVRAFFYLVKPYDYAQFCEAFALCWKEIAGKKQYIEVTKGKLRLKILLDHILYTDYSNHYSYIHTNTREVKVYMPFSEFSKLLLNYPQFLCCYRNCIVNLQAVSKMDGNDFVMKNGDRVPIQRARKSAVQQKFADYFFDQL